MMLSERSVFRYLLEEKERYVCYLGAGASVEAGVPTALEISRDIAEKIAAEEGLPFNQDDPACKQWLNETFAWNDPGRRYLKCITSRYPHAAGRLAFFRRMIAHKKPSFAHHALALLISR